MTLYGVDLSNNNWRVPAANIVPTLNEIIAEGFSWIEHKVSEGNYYTDPYWPTVGEVHREHCCRLPLCQHRRPQPAGPNLPEQRW